MDSEAATKKTGKKKKAHKGLLITAGILLILLALLFAMYPLISNHINEKNKSLVITEYEEAIESFDDAELDRMIQEARDYNETLVPGATGEEEAATFTKEYLEMSAESYYDILDVYGDGMMGYIEIPVIDVYLPVYHGTDEGVLQSGIGHILGTSFPVGGESTHSVLSGHSGMAQERMFSDLDDMQVGDLFYIHILTETFAYRVREIVTVLPEEANTLITISRGEDLVTLMTCTPFGVNTHRLLVTGERIPYEEAQEIEAAGTAVEPKVTKWTSEYLKGVLIGLGVALAIIIVFLCVRAYQNRKKAKANASAPEAKNLPAPINAESKEDGSQPEKAPDTTEHDGGKGGGSHE